MKNISLCKMTKALCRAYFKGFVYDPDLFMDMSRFPTYAYSESQSDAHWQRQQDLGRIHLAVMLESEPIGEIILKSIDAQKRCCTLSIHLKNDSVKNQGYGTAAEILALKYAFGEVGMVTVYADAVKKNKRSQHVLTKVGFIETREDETFYYYRCDQRDWQPPKL